MAAIAQRLAALGFDIFWWEMPHRRLPEPGEPAVTLPGGFSAPTQSQVDFVRSELDRVRQALETLTGQTLTDARLAAGIGRANGVRSLTGRTPRALPTQPGPCPMPRWKCSSPRCWRSIFAPTRPRRRRFLKELLAEVQARVKAGDACWTESAMRVFWVNPVPTCE